MFLLKYFTECLAYNKLSNVSYDDGGGGDQYQYYWHWLPDLPWTLRSRKVTLSVATSILITKPSVKTRSISLAAPEISREISFNHGSEQGHHGCQAMVPASQPLGICSTIRMLRGCKRFCAAEIKRWVASLDPVGWDTLSISPSGPRLMPHLHPVEESSPVSYSSLPL